MGVIWVALVVSFALCDATPLPNKLKYDQRQEGRWNVRADLENFIIMVIPTSLPGASGPSNGSLLDFLSKTIPIPQYKKPKKHLKFHHDEETEQFIESKTAPYHVDISRSKSQLAKLHPESIDEEIIIARSSPVALSKQQDFEDENLRRSRAFVFRMPIENESNRKNNKNILEGKAGDEVNKGQPLIGGAVKDTFSQKLENLADEIRTNETVSHAVIIAKTLQAGLVEYFRKVAEFLKEKREQEAALEEEEEESVSKIPELKVSKVNVVKEKKIENGEKSVNKKSGVSMLEEFKIVEKPNKEKIIVEKLEEPNEELILLGTVHEQCGPGLKRDSAGVCTPIR